MAITFANTTYPYNAYSGLKTVVDSVSLPTGGAVVYGQKAGSSTTALEFYNADGYLTGSAELGFNGTPTALIRLSDGSFLAFFENAGNNAVRLSATGAVLSPPVSVAALTDVVATSDGGFVALSTYGSAVFYTPVGNTFAVDADLYLGFVSGNFAATKLDNGTIAVAWATSSFGMTTMNYAILREDGTFARVPSAYDSVGSINAQPALVATEDGFALAYIDNGWGNTDVVLHYFDSDGDFIGLELLTTTAPAEETPSLTRLDGKIAVSWGDNTYSDTDIRTVIVPERYDPSAAAPTPIGYGTAFEENSPVVVAISADAYLNFYYDVGKGYTVARKIVNALSVTGDAADDTYVATSANEMVQLGGGNNTVSYAGSTAAVLANAFGLCSGGFAEGDYLSGVENLIGSAFADRLNGSGWANRLSGGAGNDTLAASSGTDVLIGGTGRDVLRGGTQADVFVFNAVTETAKTAQRDVIWDFLSGTDDIQLSAIDANTTRAGNQAFAFGGTTATNFAVWYKVSGSDLVVHGDVNGDRLADFQIFVKNNASLSAGDFIL